MPGFYTRESCDLGKFQELIARSTDKNSLTYARDIVSNVPLYEAPGLHATLRDADARRALLSEWAHVIGEGPGVLVIKHAVENLEALDRATIAFRQMIEEERESASGGDHFAKQGANDRVWNSLQKLCLRDPALFADLFANPAVDAVCEAWLGPGYGMTAQVNLIRPGGKAQVAHRDYHLGFMTVNQASSYPQHVHPMSAMLTLQGAIAHCDMPIESGPTKFLPFSQLYGPGYIACQLDEFRELFERNFVQIPLQKGDALFFSPALFHAGGENRSTDIHRLANLLQIGSPLGRTLEAIDRTNMVCALYPVLLESTLDSLSRAAVINAAAEGYPFPTNLDSDPPINGLAPESPAALMARALDENMSVGDFTLAIQEQQERKHA